MPDSFGGKKVLEVGLGYGTLGQLIASRNADYYGADIAEGPVANMSRRLSWLGLPEDHGGPGLGAELPFATETFDYVYSIGCLHHTGDLRGSVEEVHRVLVPGGRAVVMLYNRHSLRRHAPTVPVASSAASRISMTRCAGSTTPTIRRAGAAHRLRLEVRGETSLPRLRTRRHRGTELRRLPLWH